MTKARGIRSTKGNQRRVAERLVHQTAFKDRDRVESVNRLSPGTIMRLVSEEVGDCQIDVAFRYDQGEVLTDSVGGGTAQFRELEDAMKELGLRGWDERHE